VLGTGDFVPRNSNAVGASVFIIFLVAGELCSPAPGHTPYIKCYLQPTKCASRTFITVLASEYAESPVTQSFECKKPISNPKLETLRILQNSSELKINSFLIGISRLFESCCFNFRLRYWIIISVKIYIFYNAYFQLLRNKYFRGFF